MTTISFKHPFTLALIGLGVAVTTMSTPALASQTTSKTIDQKASETALSIDLKAGEVLELVLPKRRLGREAREARHTFETVVRPHLEEQPYTYHGSLGIDEVMFGPVKPSAVEFYSYPNATLKRELGSLRNWEELQDYRSRGWRTRDIYSMTLPDDLTLRFDPDKHYTLAVAWTNPSRPEDYDRYLDGVETEFSAVGARFMHRFRTIDYKTQSGDRELPPAQIIFVEWDDEAGLNRLLTGDAYTEFSPYFRSGIAEFRFYRLASPERS